MKTKKYDMEALKAVALAMDEAPKFSPFDEAAVSKSNALEFLRPKIVVLFTKGYDGNMIQAFIKKKGSPFIPSMKQIDEIIKVYQNEINTKKAKKASQKKSNAEKAKTEVTDRAADAEPEVASQDTAGVDVIKANTQEEILV